MTKAGQNSVGGSSDGVSADVFKFGSRNIGSISDGSFTTSGSESGHVSSAGSSNFGSVLDGLWWSPDGNLNGFQMTKAGNNSVSCGSDGVSADVF